jgi:hypothetical protein
MEITRQRYISRGKQLQTAATTRDTSDSAMMPVAWQSTTKTEDRSPKSWQWCPSRNKKLKITIKDWSHSATMAIAWWVISDMHSQHWLLLTHQDRELGSAWQNSMEVCRTPHNCQRHSSTVSSVVCDLAVVSHKIASWALSVCEGPCEAILLRQ